MARRSKNMGAQRSFDVRVRLEPWLCFAVACLWPGCGGKSSSVPSSPPSSAGTSGSPAGASGGPAGTTGGPAGASGGGGAADMDRPLQPGECRSNQDCSSALYCLEPGGRPPGGLCMPSNCSDDQDCQSDGGTAICEPRPQGCGDGKACVRGCTGNADCGVGQACKDSRCVQDGCARDTDCPTDFACSGGSCQRKPCSTDVSCSAYCVKSFCYSTPGSCEQGRP